MDRRQFIRSAAAAAVVALGHHPASHAAAAPQPAPSAARLPRWRGFNLLEKFTAGRNPPFQESDFEMMAEWGFDFVRLPLSYLCWSSAEDWKKIDETQLKHIDQVVAWGRQYRIHVNINFHRAPGYCVNPPKEPLDLWTDPIALDACAYHWRTFARRYRGIPSTQVSFDLLNEPADIPEATYTRVIQHLVETIRYEDPDRLIVADGLKWGGTPVHSLVPLNIAQSTRGYAPMEISHYRASWVKLNQANPPTWPLKLSETSLWDRDRLIRERINPWKSLAARGVGVHVGEWGAFRYTPHSVALAWMRECLELWKEAGWGWALWNLRGPFGILDSGRDDVGYESHRGRRLDRKMLELIQAF